MSIIVAALLELLPQVTRFTVIWVTLVGKTIGVKPWTGDTAV